MKIKKNLINNSFLKSAFREIHLLIIILLVAFSLSFYISKKQTPMIKETYSKATISLPQIEMFSNYHISYNIFSNNELDPRLLRQRFNIDFTTSLISSNNLEKFLDLETNYNYIQFFKQKGMDIKNYFNQNNFEISASPIDKGRQFIFIISMKHPVGLNDFSFLQNYIEFTKNIILNEYIKESLVSINRLILLLQNNLDKSKNYNASNENDVDNRIKLFKLLVDEFINDEVDDTNTNNLNSKSRILDYFTGLENKSIIGKIDFLNTMKKDISNIDYDPIIEIRTIEYYERNLFYRNFVLSILISFVVFFSIIIFKQAYKEFLRK